MSLAPEIMEMQALKLLPFSQEKVDLDAHLTRLETAYNAFDIRTDGMRQKGNNRKENNLDVA